MPPRKTKLAAIIIAVAFSIAGLSLSATTASAETTFGPDDMTGSILSIDDCTVVDRQVEVTYTNHHTTQAFYVAPRATDSAGLVTELQRTLVFSQNSVPSRDYPVSSFNGVGPWTFAITFTGDGVEYFTMDTDTVSACDSDPVRIIDPPAAPPVIDDVLVNGDARYNPTNTSMFSWVVNADRTADVTILPANTTFADGKTTRHYPAPVDVYNPPTAPKPPKGTIAACPSGKPVWTDGSAGQLADQLVQRKECQKAPKPPKGPKG